MIRPGGSSRRERDWSRDSRTTIQARVAPTNPIGTFTKKMLCQLTCSTSHPPMSGPRAMASPDMAAQMPMAAPRSLPVNVAVMIESVPGRSIAAPSPWTARNAMSWSMLWDSPQASEPRTNTPRPVRKKRLRPYRSPSAPPVSMNDANVRV